ncbi:MAG: transglutaminase domain-containing protein [Lachnospiraceae bacterium]|nr:transglutaminase domain-containing protein [Lachnospiraceae bacterium]
MNKNDKIIINIYKRIVVASFIVLLSISITACSKGNNDEIVREPLEVDTDTTAKKEQNLHTTEIITEDYNQKNTEAIVEEKTTSIVEHVTEKITPNIEVTKVEGTTKKKNKVNKTENAQKITVKYEEETTKKQDDKRDELARSILSEIITLNMSDFEKALVIHDWIAINVKYDIDNYLKDTIPSSSFSAEGALTTRVAVCDGYAKAFKLLAEKAGLEVNYVYGEADNGEWGGHAWNQVKIEGKWYNVDVTWDDPISFNNENNIQRDETWNINYEYFLISDIEMNEDHRCLSEKNSCSVSYDREKIYSYAAKNGLHGKNTVFVKNAEELVNYINMLGKHNIKDTICVWYDGFSGVTSSDFYKASYPVELTESYGMSLVRVKFNIYMSENELSKYPVAQNYRELTEIIVEKFDSGLEKFQVIIVNDGDGISIDGGRYCADLAADNMYLYGNYIFCTVIKTGIRNKDYVTKSELKNLMIINNISELIQIAEDKISSGISSFNIIYKLSDNDNQLSIPDGLDWGIDAFQYLENGDVVVKVYKLN